MDSLLRATARAEATHFWFRGFRAFVTPILSRLNLSDALILDCGCGTGANLELLGKFGHASGFDLSDVGLRIARTAGRTRLVRATVAAAPFPNASFDLVTSFDVLYSLPENDERAAVCEMYRLLRPGGYALINVAAGGALTGSHSVLSRELRRYSRTALAQLLDRAGFSIERVTYTNASLVLPMVFARGLQRWRGLPHEDDAGAQAEIDVPPVPVNEALTALLRLEALWVRYFNLPFGSSLLCLARKPGPPGAGLRADSPAGT